MSKNESDLPVKDLISSNVSSTAITPHPEQIRSLEARVEDLLEKREQQFQSYPDAVIMVSSEGLITEVNREAPIMFGYTSHQMIGQRLEMLIPDRFRHEHPSNRERYAEAPRIRPMGEKLDLHARHSSGREIPVMIMLSPIPTLTGTETMAVVRRVEKKVGK